MAKGRRQRGLGSVVKKGAGRFQVRWTIGKKANGKPDQRAKNLRGVTREEAEKYLNEQLYKSNRGEVVKATGITVAAHIEEWLDLKQMEVRVKTHKEYTKALNTYIIPPLGHLKLTDLEPRQIQQVYGKMLNQGSECVNSWLPVI
jgi:integrase